MDLTLPPIPAKYKSSTQRVRVVSEAWGAANLYCPSCGRDRVEPTPTNSEVVDFVCGSCSLGIQLKSKQKRFGRVLQNAAYAPKVRAIQERRMPDYALLAYDKASWKVTDLHFIPGHFLSLDVIEKRKALADDKERPRWVGANVHLWMLPRDAWVPVIEAGVPLPRSKVLRAYERTKPLKRLSAERLGWTVDVLRHVRHLAPVRGLTFTLQDLYASAETTLSARHPENAHVREKIRQQMQVLRDMGLVEFIPGQRGRYRMLR